MADETVNEMVKPEDIRKGDVIQSGITTYTVAEEPTNYAAPREGFPEDQSVDSSHWVVWVFKDENGVPHSYREDVRVARQRKKTPQEKLSETRMSTGSSHPKPQGRPRPNPRGDGY